MQLLQPNFSVRDFGEGVGKRDVPRFYRFYFRTFQFYAAFERFGYGVVKAGFFVLGNHLCAGRTHTDSIRYVQKTLKGAGKFGGTSIARTPAVKIPR